MKNILLVISLISVLLLAGCNKNENVENNNLQANTNDQQQEIVNTDLNKSFEERTREVRDFISQEIYGFVGGPERFVGSASMEKGENYYIMKLDMCSLKVYDEAVIENAYNLAQENGKYEFDDYIFYKDNNVPITFGENTELNSILDDYKKQGILAEKSEFGSLVILKKTPNDSNKYYISTVAFAGGSFVISDFDKTIEVILLPSDKAEININHNEADAINISVEEFYNRAMSGEQITPDGNSDYDTIKYDLSNIGDSNEYYGGDQNAVEFKEDKIVINYTIGGV